MAEVQQQEEKPNVIDISKFFGGKTLSSADIRVNKSQTLKTKPSFIAAPELASLLDVIATSVEDKNNTIERVKSVERIREREIVERSNSDATFQRALSGLRFDVDSISKSYASLIKSLETNRKNRETENRLAEDLKKQNTTRLSTERVGASLAKPTQTIAGGETETEEQQQEEGFDIKKFLGAAAVAAGLGAAGVIGGSEGGDEGGQVDPNYTPPSGKTFTIGQLKELALSVGFNEKNASIAAAVAMGESGGNPSNKNFKRPDKSYGLWQINMIDDLGPARMKEFGLQREDQLFDPVTNAKAAFKISGGSNWNPWTVYTKGIYKSFLKEAQEHKKTGTTTEASTSSSSTSTTKPAAGTPQAAAETAGTPQAAGQQAVAGTPQAEAGTPQAAAGSPSSSTVAAAPPTDTDPMEKSSANPPSVATASQKSQTPQQIAQEESSMKPASSTAVASAGITPAEITSTKTGSQSPPIMISQSPPPRSSGGSSGDGEAVGNVSVFSSTNPDNLYVAYALKELNIV